MKSKKPIRTCVYTREKKEKSELIRLVKINDSYVIDKDMKYQSRGIYVYPCEKSLIMIEKNKKYKILENDIELIKEEIKRRIKVGEVDVK